LSHRNDPFFVTAERIVTQAPEEPDDGNGCPFSPDQLYKYQYGFEKLLTRKEKNDIDEYKIIELGWDGFDELVPPRDPAKDAELQKELELKNSGLN
jgi:hypothetical protein